MEKQAFDWLDREEYPFQSHFWGLDGAKQHYIDVGEGEVFLFVHGTPSWSFDFRNVIKKLQNNFRCVALDHIGFGLSDKPADYPYSTPNHAQNLARFVEEKQLENITLVLHDFGGPIGFDFAIKFPHKIKQIVVLNSWLWSTKKEPEYLKMRKILKSPILPFLYLYLNFSPRFLLPSSFGDRKLSKELLAQFTKPFAAKHERRGALAFARSLLHDQDWFEQLWQSKSAIIDKKIILIWGMKDTFILPKYLDKFLTAFPHAEAYRLASCGHFPQEEQPEEVAKILKNP